MRRQNEMDAMMESMGCKCSCDILREIGCLCQLLRGPTLPRLRNLLSLLLWTLSMPMLKRVNTDIYDNKGKYIRRGDVGLSALLS